MALAQRCEKDPQQKLRALIATKIVKIALAPHLNAKSSKFEKQTRKAELRALIINLKIAKIALAAHLNAKSSKFEWQTRKAELQGNGIGLSCAIPSSCDSA